MLGEWLTFGGIRDPTLPNDDPLETYILHTGPAYAMETGPGIKALGVKGE